MEKFLKQVILHVIPDKKHQSVSKIAQCLEQLGVRKIGDLRFIEEKDLSTHLIPNQSKKTNECIKSNRVQSIYF